MRVRARAGARRERERLCVCLCVCVCGRKESERENGERERACARERERERIGVSEPGDHFVDGGLCEEVTYGWAVGQGFVNKNQLIVPQYPPISVL